MNPHPPRVATDCKGLVDTAARGKSRATSAKHPLARIWNSIAGCLDDNLHQLPQKGLLRWIPAHLTESAVGTTLPCGRKFSATDWRANRLADALAKSVAKEHAIPLNVQELLIAGSIATQHACALLGVVTYAANHKEVIATRKDGTTFVKKVRDSSTATGVKKVAPQKQESAAALEETELSVPADSWALDWEAAEAAKLAAGKRPAAAIQRASLKRKFAKLATLQDERNNARAIQLVASTAKPSLDAPSAVCRMSLLRERIMSKVARSEPHANRSILCTDFVRS